jgi:hypothetical protein
MSEIAENNVEESLIKLFSDLLVENRSKLDEFSIKVSDDMQKYILMIIKEHSSIFSDIEVSLKKIISDGKIDSKDTPELIILIGKMYELVYKTRKNIKKKDDYYDIIKIVLHMSFILYLQSNKIDNNEMLDSVIKIIEASIELIKLKSSIKPAKLFKFF